MFRIPFSFSRLFRLRGRRTVGADANLRRSSSVPMPVKASPLPATQVEPINAPSSSSGRKRPRSLLINPFSSLSPISKSHFTPPVNDVAIQSTSIPTIVIGRDTAQEFTPVPLPPASGHVGPQIPMDGVSVLPPPQSTSPPTSTRIPFQLPTTLARIDDRPESPLSTCSTLITEIEARREAEAIADRTAVAPVASSTDHERTSAAPAGHSNVAKTRHASLIAPKPVRAGEVRVNRSRFSLPVRPKTVSPIVGGSANGVAGDGRRESRRASLLSFASNESGSTAVRKEGRMARFSKDFSKPETQEVLRALAWRM